MYNTTHARENTQTNTVCKRLTQNKTERRPAVWITDEHSNPHEWINEYSISVQQPDSNTL